MDRRRRSPLRSPDGSGAICDTWAEKDSRIRVIHQKNAGSGAARNAALDLSKGELIAFVDSDDYLCRDTYMHLTALLRDDVDIAECGYVETFDDQAEFVESDDEIRWFSLLNAITSALKVPVKPFSLISIIILNSSEYINKRVLV